VAAAVEQEQPDLLRARTSVEKVVTVPLRALLGHPQLTAAVVEVECTVPVELPDLAGRAAVVPATYQPP